MIHSGFLALSRRYRRRLLIGSVAVGLSGIAWSQAVLETEPPEEEKEIRRYTVEMIVFEYAASAVSGNEVFEPDELPEIEDLLSMPPAFYGDPGTNVNADLPGAIDEAEIDDEYAQELLLPEEPEAEQILEELPSHILHTQLKVLDPEQHAMQDIYEKLVALDAYKPIMRAAWTQATYEKDQTLPIRLRRIGNAPLRLDGNLRLYLSRYLHFVVDLTIESEQAQSGGRDDDGVRYYGDRRTSRNYGYGYGYGYGQETTTIKYNISEDRIFRNGELRYYDHPRFGVLARITRYEEEEIEALETDEMFLLPGN